MSDSTAIVKGQLKGVDPQILLARYLANERSDAIAADYGVTRRALAKHLLTHAEDDWKMAQVSKAIVRKEEAEEMLEEILASMPDMLERNTRELAVARARVCEQILRSAQWELERVCDRVYGRKDHLTVEKTGEDFAERLRRARERVVEGISTRISELPVTESEQAP